MDLVSIIIPFFKKKKFIYGAVKSALKQTYKNIEIIIVYDDKDKKDLNYLKKIFRKFSKVKIINNKNNFGAGISRNIGILASKGKYIAFLDSDDGWKKNKLKIQINAMKKNNLLISHTSYFIKDENNKLLGTRIAKSFNNQAELLKSCDIGLSTVVLKKKLFSRNLRFCNWKTKEDFILWLEILKKGYKIYGIKQVLGIWKKTKGSLSSSTIQKLKDGFNVYFIFMKFNFIKSFAYLILLSINYFKKNYSIWN